MSRRAANDLGLRGFPPQGLARQDYVSQAWSGKSRPSADRAERRDRGRSGVQQIGVALATPIWLALLTASAFADAGAIGLVSAPSDVPPNAPSWQLLGCVDGFDQDEAESKRDERAVILRRLLASKCDTLEAFELADSLFNACPCLVECFRKEGGHILGVGSIRDCRTYSALARGVAV